jgi:hypothetical protein
MSRRRIARLAASLFALLGLAGLAPGAGTPAGAAVAVDTSHPYSNPVWYPLRNISQSDCYKSNPDPLCVHNGTAYHGYWAMDIDSQPPFPSDDPVMAMGAGIVHIGSTDYRCGPDHAGIGAFLWIDHGNGVRSIYGHLNAIAVKEGQYVTPTTRLAYVGESGYGRCAVNDFKYLYVAVKHDRTYVEIPRMYVCEGGVQHQWPQDRGYTSWNTIPVHTHLPAVSSTCIKPAATPNRPGAPTVVRAGSDALRMSWSAGSRVVRTVVEIEGWHPTINRYTAERKIILTSGTSVTARSLTSAHKYRVRLWFYNYGGYSAPSAWRYGYPDA